MDEEQREGKTKIVLPGEELVEDMNVLAGSGTFREGKKVHSKIVGLFKNTGSIVSVIPLAGRYNPKRGDMVIGEVAFAGVSNWRIDIASAYSATLPLSEVPEYIEKGADLMKYYRVGDLMMVKVNSVSELKIIQLTMRDRRSRKLFGGKVVEIIPSKVPRLIGKEGTMITAIKDRTGCMITVGQNGRVWIKGGEEDLATEAVMMVDAEAHTDGLTDRIIVFLDSEAKKRGIVIRPPEHSGEMEGAEHGAAEPYGSDLVEHAARPMRESNDRPARESDKPRERVVIRKRPQAAEESGDREKKESSGENDENDDVKKESVENGN